MKPAAHNLSSGSRSSSGVRAVRTGVGEARILVRRAGVLNRAERAFTMIEIALSIAVVAFALVAIMGVLPTGLNVQRDNREETIINQDAAYILQAIRSGTTNLDAFLRNVDMIQITNPLSPTPPQPLPPFNGMPNPLRSADLNFNTTPETLLSFLTTRKKRPYVEEALAIARNEPPGLITNVTARVRAFSGPLADRGASASARELAFTYLLFCEIIPYDAYPTNVIDDAIKNGQMNIIKTAQVQGHNLYEVRLEFRWPALEPGNPDAPGRHGNGRLVYRSLIAGSITNYYAIPGVNGAPGSGPLLSRFAHLAYTNPLPPPKP